MGKGIDYSLSMIVVFVIVFVVFGFRELMGYPINPSHVLVFSCWSFATAVVQLLETVMSLVPKCVEVFERELHAIGRDNKENILKLKSWYASYYGGFKFLADLIMIVFFSVGMCFIFGGVSYENDALSNGLTMLAIALFFFSIVVREIIENKIKRYRLKKEI